VSTETATPHEPEPQPTTTAQQEWATAAEATAAAGEALTAAYDAIGTAQQDLELAEANVVEVVGAAVINGGGPSRTEIGKARTAVEKCRSDLEWAKIQHQAAEVAYTRAVDNEITKRRAVIAEQYLAEHARFNDPESRENVLLAQISDAVAELLPAIAARKERHGVLTKERAHFPATEPLPIPQGRPIRQYDSVRTASVTLREPEVADAIKAGIDRASAR
jgi:hypothetical protein